jgi:cation:H+ antiporter
MSILALSLALLAGFVALLLSADLLVRGVAALARWSGAPPLAAGLIIGAFGASLPEMFVAVRAVRAGAPGLALGDIVGANIANVLLALSIPTLIRALPTELPDVRRNAVIMVGASAGFIALALGGGLDPVRGAVLIAGIAAYVGFEITRRQRAAGDAHTAEPPEETSGLPESWPALWLFIVVGVVGLPIGAAMIVHGATGLAQTFGASDILIGLTVVALGTTLPELITAVIAARRGHPEVAVGNVIASNIFNVLAVGGLAGLAGGLPVPRSFFVLDFPVMMLAELGLLFIVLARRPIDRIAGAVMFVAYVAYVIGLAQRAM